MHIVFDGQRVAFLEHVDEVGHKRAVGGIGIEAPFQIAQSSPFAVMTAMVGRRSERLAHEVGYEQRDTSGLRVDERGVDRTVQVFFAGQVHDRIVDEDGVEHAPQAHRAHIALEVLAIGIDRAARRQHPFGHIDQRHREVGLHVECVVAAAAAELDERLRRRCDRTVKDIAEAGGFVRIVFLGREDRPPMCKLAVQFRSGHDRQLLISPTQSGR